MEKKAYLMENYETKSPKWYLIIKNDIFPYAHWMTASHYFNTRKNIKENFKQFCDEKGYTQMNCL